MSYLVNKMDKFKTKADAIAYIQENVDGCADSKRAQKYLIDHIPKENYYQDKIIKFLKSTYQDGVCWKETAGAYSRCGIPDVTFILNGRYYGFEVKRPYFGVLSTIQEQTIKKIRAAGGVAEVVTFPEEVQRIVEENR